MSEKEPGEVKFLQQQSMEFMKKKSGFLRINDNICKHYLKVSQIHDDLSKLVNKVQTCPMDRYLGKISKCKIELRKMAVRNQCLKRS